MVDIGDKILVFQQPNGEYIALEPGTTPQEGDNIIVHQLANGEYVTNGVGSIAVGDTVLVKRVKDSLDKNDFIAETGGDEDCLRQVRKVSEVMGQPNGGSSYYYKPKKPMVVGVQWFPIIYVDTFNRHYHGYTSAGGEGYEGNDWQIGDDFQAWYPYGRIRFYFSGDGLPSEDPDKSWVGTDGLPPNIIQIGDVSCNKFQDVYSWPDEDWGGWIFEEGMEITDIWVHIRNTSSFFWHASCDTKISRIRICYQTHEEYKDGED